LNLRSRNQLYSKTIIRKTALNKGERIQVQVPEYEDYIISKTIAINRNLDVICEIIDLNWKDEFNIMN